MLKILVNNTYNLTSEVVEVLSPLVEEKGVVGEVVVLQYLHFSQSAGDVVAMFLLYLSRGGDWG